MAQDIRALLVTDIVGSTALSERLGDQAIAALWTAHDRIARDLLAARRGQEIDRSDGFLLLFDTAADAVRYATDYHRALASLDPPLQARAGLHVGPVVLRSNTAADIALGAKPVEVEGIAKPTAARVMTTARGGQTLLTAQARAALGATDLRIQSHGYWRMKGFTQPLELFEVGDGNAPFTPPPDSDKTYRVVPQQELWLPVRQIKHSLRAERDAFIGRHEPLLDLARRFEEGARLVSMLGIGGTGKTRLATRFGWTWLGDFPGGVWFCDLSPARSLDGVVSAVAQGLDVPLGGDDPITRLGNAIAGRGRCLVILDNFEQVARYAEETLGRWLVGAAEARFLVTTREVLGLAGEQTFALAPLPQDEAAALFVRRAVSAKHDLRLTAEDHAAIAPLAKLLDGLPLAIELAAARVRVMPPRMLLARMSERFRLLRSSGGRQDRQATLRAAFDWSWDLLSPPDKSALAQLSVFEGGFALDAAEAVLDLSEYEDAPWPADAVHSLVDKSFVRATPDARFELLVSVQEYAAEHLRTEGRFIGSGPDALQSAHARHCAYFAVLGEERAVADACADLDNLVTACRRAVSRGDAETATGALEGAWAALGFRGPFSAGTELAAAVRCVPGLTAGARARIELVAGLSLDASGKAPEAQSRFEAALRLAREAGERRCEARTSVNLGELHASEGRLDEARAEHLAALALARSIGDGAIECAALNGLGTLHYDLGQMDEAQTHYEAALARARELGDRRWEGSVLGNLGGVFSSVGRIAEARTHYEASLLGARELGDRQREGNALCNLGLMHYTQGQLNDARDRSDAALAVAREMGHGRLECIVLCNLGLICEALHRLDEARVNYEAALVLARKLGDRRSQGQFLTYLGLLHAREARFAQAHECLDAGEALLRAVSDPFSLGLLLCSRTEAHHLAGAPAAARAGLQEAKALAEDLGVGPESEIGVALVRVEKLLAAGSMDSPPQLDHRTA